MGDWQEDFYNDLSPRPRSPFGDLFNWKYMKSVSNLLLCGSCSFALYALRRESFLSRCPYWAMLSHGVIGSLRHSHSVFDNSVMNCIHEVSSKMARIGLLPLISAGVAAEDMDDPHVAFLHSCLFLMSLVSLPILKTPDFSDHICDLVALTGEVYLSCMATVNDKINWALLVEGDFVNRFFLTNLCQRIPLPSEDFYIIGLAVLCFLGPFLTHDINIRFKKVDHRSTHNYATCLAHICLSGISGWCVSRSLAMEVYPIAVATFAIVLIHGIVGVFRFGHPNLVVHLRSVYAVTFNASRIMPVALLTTQLYQRVNNSLWAIVQISSTGIPILDVLFTSGGHDTVKFLILLGNIMSLLYFGVMADNYWALGLALLCVINCFVIDKLAENFSVPLIDLFTVGLCFFNVFAYNSLVELKTDQEYDF